MADVSRFFDKALYLESAQEFAKNQGAADTDLDILSPIGQSIHYHSEFNEGLIYKTQIDNAERYLITATRKDSLYRLARSNRMTVDFAKAAKVNAALVVSVNDLRTAYGNKIEIPNDIIIDVEGIQYSIDYPIEVVAGVSENVLTLSARYIIDEDFTNPVSDTVNPNIKVVRKTVDNQDMLYLLVTAQQYVRDTTAISYIDENTSRIMTLPLEGRQIVDFSVIYTDSPFVPTMQQQLDAAMHFENSTSKSNPTIFFRIDGENLQLESRYFEGNIVPSRNSVFTVTLYVTQGAEGNTPMYVGDSAKIIPTTELSYSLKVVILGESKGGADEPSIEEYRNIIMDNNSRRKGLISVDDLNSYYKINNTSSGTFYKITKARNDFLARVFEVFAVLYDDDLKMIIPTNTLDITFKDSDATRVKPLMIITNTLTGTQKSDFDLTYDEVDDTILTKAVIEGTTYENGAEFTITKVDSGSAGISYYITQVSSGDKLFDITPSENVNYLVLSDLVGVGNMPAQKLVTGQDDDGNNIYTLTPLDASANPDAGEVYNGGDIKDKYIHSYTVPFKLAYGTTVDSSGNVKRLVELYESIINKTYQLEYPYISTTESVNYICNYLYAKKSLGSSLHFEAVIMTNLEADEVTLHEGGSTTTTNTSTVSIPATIGEIDYSKYDSITASGGTVTIEQILADIIPSTAVVPDPDIKDKKVIFAYLVFRDGDTFLGYLPMTMISYDETAFKYLYSADMKSDEAIYDNKMVVELFNADGIRSKVKLPVGSVDISVCIYRDEKVGEASFNYSAVDTGMPSFDGKVPINRMSVDDASLIKNMTNVYSLQSAQAISDTGVKTITVYKVPMVDVDYLIKKPTKFFSLIQTETERITDLYSSIEQNMFFRLLFARTKGISKVFTIGDLRPKQLDNPRLTLLFRIKTTESSSELDNSIKNYIISRVMSKDYMFGEYCHMTTICDEVRAAFTEVEFIQFHSANGFAVDEQLIVAKTTDDSDIYVPEYVNVNFNYDTVANTYVPDITLLHTTSGTSTT